MWARGGAWSPGSPGDHKRVGVSPVARVGHIPRGQCGFRRGELEIALPVGLVYGPDGRVCLDPDRQIQDTVRLLFDTFRETGSACAVLRRMRAQHILFPRRITRGIGKGLAQELLKRGLGSLHLKDTSLVDGFPQRCGR